MDVFLGDIYKKDYDFDNPYNPRENLVENQLFCQTFKGRTTSDDLYIISK